MSLSETLKAHKMAREARVLILDIETRPTLSYTWGLFNQNIGLNQIEDPGGTMGVGFKWLGDRRAQFVSDHVEGHEGMLETVYEAMSQASAIVHFNGDSFDLKHLNWEFEQAGLGKPKPYRSVDLLKVVRANFRPISKKLDHVSQALDLGAKVKHEGFDLWRACMNGDDKAWARMGRYCKQDVNLTEALYLRLLPWLPGTAHVGVMVGSERSCPNCGGEDLTEAGSTFTALTEFALYRCDGCRTWVRTNFVKGRSTIRVAR